MKTIENREQLLEAEKQRHAVRSYTDKPIDPTAVEKLEALSAQLSKEGNLNIQLILDDPAAFKSGMARFGSFENVRNCIAIGGAPAPDLEERAGYYGEQLVLLAQTLGLNTCWVGMTFNKSAVRSTFKLARGEKLVIVISLGYGTTQGSPHKVKDLSEICDEDTAEMPDWYRAGLESALLAPTAVNQQKFSFSRKGTTVTAKADPGALASLDFRRVDLGIVKFHFELGAGPENFTWGN